MTMTKEMLSTSFPTLHVVEHRQHRYPLSKLQFTTTTTTFLPTAATLLIGLLFIVHSTTVLHVAHVTAVPYIQDGFSFNVGSSAYTALPPSR